jgi:hypothetical protein
MANSHGGIDAIRPELDRWNRGGGLHADELLTLALKRAKRREFLDRSFLEPLRHLLEACRGEANLSVLGSRALRVDVLRFLRNLLRFEEYEAACPAVLSRPIQAPVFITGMPRSGTTFLHRLILQDPGTIAPRLFQLVDPHAWQAGRLRTALRKRWVGLQLALFRILSPEFNALHQVGVDAPEECTEITAHVFQSQRFESTYRVPSYSDWLQHRGLLAGYRFHRRFLQHLDAALPGRRWVLKSPDHVFALDDIRTVYPDARLVFIHRDPVRVLASVTRLTEVLRRSFARGVNRMELGRHVSAAWIDGAQRMSTLSARDHSVLHLHYRQIVHAPLDAVRSVYRHCGLVLTDEAEARMCRWLKTAVHVSRPSRGYDLAEYGLDPHLLRERFADYTDTFDIELERYAAEASTAAST